MDWLDLFLCASLISVGGLVIYYDYTNKEVFDRPIVKYGLMILICLLAAPLIFG